MNKGEVTCPYCYSKTKEQLKRIPQNLDYCDCGRTERKYYSYTIFICLNCGKEFNKSSRALDDCVYCGHYGVRDERFLERHEGFYMAQVCKKCGKKV